MEDPFADAPLSSMDFQPTHRVDERVQPKEDSAFPTPIESAERVPKTERRIKVTRLVSRKKFAILKTHIRHVPQEVVKERWDVVSEPVQDRIRELFKSVQKPVITGHGDERRRTEAQAAVGSVLRTLGKRLPKIPFPQSTKDVHFNFETILASNQALDSQITLAIHAIGLLKAEITREEHSLTAERRILQELEANSRAEESLRKRQAKNVHPLLRSGRDFRQDIDVADDVGLDRSAQPESLSPVAKSDAKILPILADLQNHLDNINANTVQATNIRNRIFKARAVIDDALYSRTDLSQYEYIAADY
ncbi:MAG: hypothetical protein M1830_001326 [Pleopsidium flavum]|nr:MAG: hypothetical protein M1830_001326 [Pleopsidium flavum]